MIKKMKSVFVLFLINISKKKKSFYSSIKRMQIAKLISNEQISARLKLITDFLQYRRCQKYNSGLS